MHPLIKDLLKAIEEFYYRIPEEQQIDEELFCIEQVMTLISNMLDNNPELENEVRNYISILRTI